MFKTKKLVGTTEKKTNKDKIGENFPHLEITGVVLVHFNFFNNDYQHNSGALFTFPPNESFGQLLDILSKNFIFLKTFNSEFSDSLRIKILNH